ncbi:MAG: hypothetical protein E7536_02175 [Ruminococcaceae bacterium]|nr:hypothetical protein [Oscillospiraceae bacterium]
MLNIREVFILDVKLIRLRRKKKAYVGGIVVQASRHIVILILFAVLFMGLLSGNLIVKSNENIYNKIFQLFNDYILSSSGQAFIKTFFTQSVYNVVLIFIMSVLGLCAVGFPLPVLITFMKGVSIGALSSFLYTHYTLKGFGFCMLAFFPVQILYCLILLRAGKECFNMSINILRYIAGNKQKNDEDLSLKLYLLRSLILLIFVILVSLISTTITVYINPLFNF